MLAMFDSEINHSGTGEDSGVWSLDHSYGIHTRDDARGLADELHTLLANHSFQSHAQMVQAHATFTGAQPNDVSPVTVVGYPPGGGGGAGGGGGGDGGGDTDPSHGQNPTSPGDPYSFDYQCTNAAAAKAAKEIAGSSVEYDIGIYRTPDGVIHMTDPVTSGSAESAPPPGFPNPLPSGSIILGTVHNHPIEPGVSGSGSGLPSFPNNASSQGGVGSDYDIFYQYYNYDQQIQDNSGGEFHMYIISGDGIIYEYNSDNITNSYSPNDILGNVVDPNTTC